MLSSYLQATPDSHTGERVKIFIDSPTGRSIPVLSAVLFDLDGTLLDINLDHFLREYFAALGPVVAEVVTDISAEQGLAAVVAGTDAMSLPHPGLTNREAFNRRFHAMTGTDLDLEEFALPFERFYRDVFPSLRQDFAPMPGARQAIETSLNLGLKVAVATNPIFPRSAVNERMRWAGIDDIGVELVTTYENMHATKPHGAYFSEVAALLGVETSACLMVGDDRFLDMPASDIGMRTFYVGPDTGVPADWSGTLGDLAALLPRITREA
jgi:FMN phosphatase YigB (HAD superfamily)